MDPSIKEWLEHLETFLWDLSSALIDHDAPTNIKEDVVAARRKYRENTENL